ncbi:MAG: DUF2797 domain-containing protein [Bacteroidales bacterium]
MKSLLNDKVIGFSGIMQGIRGQYWIFEGGDVINIRKYGGYLVDIEVEEFRGI